MDTKKMPPNPSKKGLGGITYPLKPESGSKPKPSGFGSTPVRPKPKK